MSPNNLLETCRKQQQTPDRKKLFALAEDKKTKHLQQSPSSSSVLDKITNENNAIMRQKGNIYSSEQSLPDKLSQALKGLTNSIRGGPKVCLFKTV